MVGRALVLQTRGSGFDPRLLHLKNKYHRYSFHGLEVELRQIITKLANPDLQYTRAELLRNKAAIEKEITIRKDPYYIPGSEK